MSAVAGRCLGKAPLGESTSPPKRGGSRSPSPARSAVATHLSSRDRNRTVPDESSQPAVARVTSENIAECFRGYDTNGDGKINRAELRRVFATLDQHGRFTEDDVDTIMNELDTSKDGVIDYFEFAAWLKGDSPSEAENMKRQFKNAASKTLTPAQTVARLEEELRKAEESQAFPNSVEVFLDEHHLWIFTGMGETVKSLCSSEEPSIVKQISPIMEAYEKGVRIGFHVSRVGDENVRHTDNVMRKLVQGCQGAKKKVRVKFVSPEQVKAYEVAAKAMPTLREALDVAKAECSYRDGMHDFLVHVRER